MGGIRKLFYNFILGLIVVLVVVVASSTFIKDPLKLIKDVLAATTTWDFTNSSDYTFDSSKIEVSSGQAQLKAPDDWYNPSWSYRKKITFNNSDQVENLTDFPVLIKLNSSRINYSNIKDAGEDIRFTDSDGTTLLAHEIETWNESGDTFVWVKVPQIDASSDIDHIYMYYGNNSAIDQQQTTSVWNTNFKGVWHMKEDEGVAQGPIYSLAFSERINDVFPASTRPHVQGVASDGTYLYITQDDQIKKLNKSDYSLVDSRINPHLDGIDMTQVNNVFVHEDYLYLGANNYDTTTPKLGSVKIFNKNDLSFVGEHQVANNWSEGGSFHDNSWWIVYFDSAFVSRYDADWNHIANYPLQRNYSQGNIWIGDYFYVPKSDPNHIEVYHWDGNTLDFVKLLSLPYEMNNAINGIDKEQNEDVLWLSELLYNTNHNNLVKTTIDWTLFDLSESTVNANHFITKRSSLVEGQISKAQLFNGSNNSATITDDDSLDFGTGSFTYQTWVKTGSSTGNQGIIDKRGSLAGTSGYRGYLLWTSAGVLKANISGDDAGTITITSTGPSISDETWYHVTVVVNKATNLQYLYVNGSLVDSDSIAGITGSVSTQSNLMFGYKSTTGGTSITYFNGTVDEVRISDTAHSPAWVAASYKSENDTFNSFGSIETPYMPNNPYIQPTSMNPLTFTAFSGFSETATKNGGEIKYQISNDAGTTWNWYNSGWTPTSSGYFEANTASEINSNISSFPTGGGQFLFKAYLHSDGSQLVQLDSIALTHESNSSSSPPGPPVCNTTSPQSAPWLYGARAKSSNSIILQFSEAKDPVSEYVVEYGTETGKYPFAMANIGSKGTTSYLVQSLNPNTTYYFRVRASNGCATGSWSNELSATTTGKSVFTNNLETNILEVEEKKVDSQTECKTYTVTPGDSLTRISQDQLGDSTKVSQLIEQNKDKYPSLETNPSALEVGWELTISCEGKDQEQSQTDDKETQIKEVTKTVLIKVVDENKNPVKGAKVTLHSTPRETKSDENGVARFSEVEVGEHRVVIAYQSQTGEQKINVKGDSEVDEIDFTIQIKTTNPFLNPWVIGVVTLLATALVISLVVILKNRKSA